MSCKNRRLECGCTPVSPCDKKQEYCCLCYSHQWYNSPKYSECSRRVKVNDLRDNGCDCGCTNQTVAQDNFSYSSCGCDDNETDAFTEIDELYWQ